MNRLIQEALGSSRQYESAPPKPVIEDTRPVKFYRCPHCQQEIFEKHDYVDQQGQTRHRECGGAFNWPPIDPNSLSPEWRHILKLGQEAK